MYDLSSGLGIQTPHTGGEILVLRQYLADDMKRYDMKKKMERIQKKYPDINRDEAAALANWVGHDYGLMNKRIYAPDSLTASEKVAILTVDELATQALMKMPRVTAAQAKKHADEHFDDFDPKKPLERFISVPDPEGFVNTYRKALNSGETHVETSFLATSHSEHNPFKKGEKNIKYEVKGKLNGTGQGRYVDDLKNAIYEGEILYPPFSKFKVTGIREQFKTTGPAPADILSESELEQYTQYNAVKTAKYLAKSAKSKSWQDYYFNLEDDHEPPTNLAKLKKTYKELQAKIDAQTHTKISGYVIEMEEI
jgi:hypothetical protein